MNQNGEVEANSAGILHRAGRCSGELMATSRWYGRSKALEVGARQFVEVTAGLNQITELSETTTAAARETELGTKQQATAVGQVTAAVSNVANHTDISPANELGKICLTTSYMLHRLRPLRCARESCCPS